MLEYDNTAFYYFALTFLVIYAVPGTYYALSELFIAFVYGMSGEAKARTSAEGKKSGKLKQQMYGYARINTNAFWINLGITAFCWVTIVAIVTLVLQDGDVQSFNPHDILGVSEEATMSQIKKAYRGLSLKYHPDKNPNDQDAADTFMRIAKAYQALTDPEARENFKKYGNPDGKQSLEVSIGLPVLLLDNPKVVLVLYLCGMIIFIPAAVGAWYSNSQQFGDKDIKYDTYTMFYQMLSPDQSTLKGMPELLACSAEFGDIVEECMPGSRANFQPPALPAGAEKMTQQQQMQLMQEAQRKMMQTNPYKSDDIAISKLLGSKLSRVMQKPRFEHPMVLRTNVLLHAHMLRLTDDLSSTVVRMLDKLLLKSPALLAGVVEIALNRRWLNTAKAAIAAQRLLVQAVAWPGAGGIYNDLPPASLPLLQLPHFTEKEVRAVLGVVRGEGAASDSTSGTAHKIKTLHDFLCLPDADKVRGLEHLSETQRKDILAAARVMPRTRVETSLYVEEDEGDADNFYLANADKETKEKIDKRRSRGDVDEDEEEQPKETKEKGRKGGKKQSLATLASPEVLAAGNATPTAAVKKLREHEVKGGDIYEGDLITLRLVITRPGGDDKGNADAAATVLGPAEEGKTIAVRNAASLALEKQQVPVVHAPHYPGVVKEGLWVILSEPPMTDSRIPATKNQKAEVPIHAMERLTSQSRVVVKEMKFMAPPHAGDYTMQLSVLSDAYVGMDYATDIRFTVLSAAVLPVQKPHEEDVALDKEPTIFEQMLGQTADDDSDSDSEEEEEEQEAQEGQAQAKAGAAAAAAAAGATATAAAAAAVSGGKKKMVVVAEDDGSDDE